VSLALPAYIFIILHHSCGTSLSIVSDCRLDDRGLIRGRDKGFFFSILCVQTSYEAHPASHPIGTSPGANCGRGVTILSQFDSLPIFTTHLSKTHFSVFSHFAPGFPTGRFTKDFRTKTSCVYFRHHIHTDCGAQRPCCRGIKQPVREADHTPQSNSEV
jgi:hypothetical protein